MAFAINTYTGNGSLTSFSVSFPYIEQAHVIVTVGGVTKTVSSDYNFTNASTIAFSSAPANGAIIKFTRSTNRTARLVDYQDGSTITEAILDQDGNQSFFMAQEAIDITENTIGLNANDEWDATTKKIVNVVDPTVAQGAATKNYVDTKLAADINTINSHKTAAETAKTAAETAETNAETAETNAVTAKNAAVVAQTAAETALDTFDDRFLGAKSSNPSVDNDGNALVDGALYFDTANDIMKVYDLSNTQWRQLTLTSTNQTNVNTVAGQISPTNNISSVAGKATEIGLLGTSANVTAMGLLGTSAVVTDMDLLGTSSNVTAMATLGTSTNVTNIATLAGVSNLNNLANAHAAVSNVNTNLQAVQNFADVYRISSSAPTSSLNAGDLYFDTTANELKVYKSSGWAAAGSTVNGTSNRFEYTATANQTTFTGSDTNSKTLAYDAGFIDCYLNGVKLANADFTATSGTSIVLGTGASVNDILMVVAYGTFQLANISINDLTNTPASIGTAGQALVVNSAGNALEYANASSAEVYGFNKYYNPSTLVRTVTVQSVGGANKYFIDGVQQDTLDLYEGNTYIFNYPSAHPFKFSTTSNGTHASGSEYTTGVTHNSSTQVTIVVASGAPTLYYYCASHSAMGGQANTPTPANNAVQYITTNQGQDNITESQYANFDDVLFSASGFVFSINSNGNLITTI
jgi:hypothetical protein